MKRLARMVAIAAVAAVSVALPVDAAPSFRMDQRFPFKGGLELASQGDFVYASQWNGHLGRVEHPDWGGVHIFDVSADKVKKVGFLHCPGYDNDVAVVRPGIIAVGYGDNRCAPEPNTPGVLLADVSDPARPRLLSTIEVYYAHTISVHPTEPLLYASPGGWLPAGNDGRVDIVDVSDPHEPKIVGDFTYPGFGCHDVSFDIRKDREIAFCPNASPNQLILDVSDPRSPTILSAIPNPAIQYGHTALVSPDGSTLAITDEAFVAHECVSDRGPAGALWLYDVSTPEAPVLLGYRSPPKISTPVGNMLDGMPSYCAAAMIDWVTDTKLVTSWYAGGVSLMDVAPGGPESVGFYRPTNALAYGVDYYRGRLYVNDINRGVEVLELRG